MTARLLALAMAGAAGLALVTPASALAASHPASHPASHATAKGHAVAHGKPARPPKDRLAGPRAGAARSLSGVTAQVNRVAAKEAASTLLGAEDKTAVAAFDSAALQALTADSAALAAATTLRGLQDVVEAGKRTGQGVDLVQRVVTDAARTAGAADRLADGAAAVLEQEQALADGTDTTDLDAALAS